MATLTGYVSAVAAAARKLAGADGVALAGRQEGEVEEKAAVVGKPAAMAADEVKPERTHASVPVEESTSTSGPDSIEHASAPDLIRPLRKPSQAAEADGPVVREVAAQPETQALRVQAASPREDRAEAARAAVQAQAREELIGSDVGRSAGRKSVEVVLHAADDLTAVIAESDEVREAVLRAVAEVLRER
jgi:hypothetical protein